MKNLKQDEHRNKEQECLHEQTARPPPPAYLVRVANCRKAMSNQNNGAFARFHELINGGLHNGFRFIIQSTGCFVQDEQLWLLDESTGCGAGAV